MTLTELSTPPKQETLWQDNGVVEKTSHDARCSDYLQTGEELQDTLSTVFLLTLGRTTRASKGLLGHLLPLTEREGFLLLFLSLKATGHLPEARTPPARTC